MTHSYEFFDRATFDRIWQLSWQNFLQKYRTGWSRNRLYDAGSYNGESLRGLIAFSLEPEPSAEEIEQILERNTIRWTIQHSMPQLFVLSSIIWDGLTHLRNRAARFSTKESVNPVLATAIDAYLQSRVTASTLRATLKLHSVENPSDFLELTRREKQRVAGTNLRNAMWRPIYRWQGEQWLKGEQVANAVGVLDARRFADFVIRAWNENWPTPRLDKRAHKLGSRNPQFRDFSIANDLAKLSKKIAGFIKPSGFYQWS